MGFPFLELYMRDMSSTVAVSGQLVIVLKLKDDSDVRFVEVQHELYGSKLSISPSDVMRIAALLRKGGFKLGRRTAEEIQRDEAQASRLRLQEYRDERAYQGEL
jgi:hypothetical protein